MGESYRFVRKLEAGLVLVPGVCPRTGSVAASVTRMKAEEPSISGTATTSSTDITDLNHPLLCTCARRRFKCSASLGLVVGTMPRHRVGMYSASGRQQDTPHMMQTMQNRVGLQPLFIDANL